MLPFERLGPYIIKESLGSGGMGSVFLGVNESTGQSAAVKVLSPALAADMNFRTRFGTEVETLKKLTHPNIVQLLGYGEQDGQLFYAMEMVPGRSLQEELHAGRRFTWREVARIGVEICQALKHAHDRGVIHRDLKPANLLYTEDDHIKLSDFGIAKLYGMTQLTAEGGVLGTVDYMAPEQAEGKGVTARSDLYSLGCVLYALLAGRPPFAARTVPEVIHKVRYEEALPVGRLAPSTPEEFERIIAELLAKNPQDRIATALAVANRLKAMDYALSLETRVDDGMEPPDEADEGPAPPDEEVRVENGATEHSAVQSETSLSRDTGVPDDSLQRHRNSTVGMSQLSSSDAASDMEMVAGTHFTTFDEEARRRATSSRGAEDSTPLWLKITPLLFAVAAISVGIWYMAQPIPAASLYDRIMKVANEGEPRDLADVEDLMDQFLARFPRDDRSDEIRSLREELELYRLQRQYERRSRLRGGTDAFGPVERAYVAAMQQAVSDPHGAALQLQALLDVYSRAPGNKKERQCLRLAAEQLNQLKARGKAVVEKDLTTINGRLDEADDLAADEPERAAAIRRGVIQLYGDQTWARDAVQRARQALEPGEKGPSPATDAQVPNSG